MSPPVPPDESIELEHSTALHRLGGRVCPRHLRRRNPRPRWPRRIQARREARVVLHLQQK